MVKISYEQLNNPEWNMGLRKLDSFTGFPVKTTYRVSRVSEKVTAERKRAGEIYQKLLKEHCVLNDKGEPKFTPRGEPDLKEGVQEAYNAKFKEFTNTEFEVKVYPIKLSELEKVQMSGAEMAAIYNLLDFEETPEATETTK